MGIVTEKVKQDTEAFRLNQMISTMPVNVMMLETENFTITYANETSFSTLKPLEHLLPCKAGELVGQCVDIFHKDPSHQRRLLADPKHLPHTAIIGLGDEKLELLVSAVHDRDGNYIAAMLTWSVVTEKLRKEADAARLEQMIETMPINIMLAEPENLDLTYMNKMSRDTLRTLEGVLPIKVDDMIGQSIDIFHKDPSHQRRILGDPKNLPHSANIKLGDHTLKLDVSAVMGQNGEYIGPMVAWSVVTEQVNLANDVASTVELVAARQRKCSQVPKRCPPPPSRRVSKARPSRQLPRKSRPMFRRWQAPRSSFQARSARLAVKSPSRRKSRKRRWMRPTVPTTRFKDSPKRRRRLAMSSS